MNLSCSEVHLYCGQNVHKTDEVCLNANSLKSFGQMFRVHDSYDRF